MRITTPVLLVILCAPFLGCGGDDGTTDAGRDATTGGNECFCCNGTFAVPMEECAALCASMCPDAGTDAGSDDGGGGMTDPRVNLTFAGCTADFSGDIVVVNNSDSIAVTSTSGGSITGSIQLALQSETGVVDVTTQHRVDTGAVINVIAGTTWTNIARDSAAVLGGTATDPISGTMNIRTYDEAAGMVDVEFTAVTLQNPSDDSICLVEGRLETFELSF